MVDVAELLDRAKAHHRAGQLREAEQLYRQILAAKTDNADVYFLLAAVCDDLGKSEEAIANLRQVLRVKGDHAVAHNFLGALLARLGQLDEAIENFQRAIRLQPDLVDATNNLRSAMVAQHNLEARALDERGQLDEAADCYRRALQLAPDFAETHYNLGLIDQRQAKFASAVDRFRQAVRLRPDFVEAQSALGVALFQLGNVDEAEACHRRALELRPDSAEYRALLGGVLKQQEKLEEAVACFTRALELRPDFVPALVNLGNTLRHQGKLDEAVTCQRRAIAIQPDSAVAHYNLAFALMGQNKLDEVAAAYDAALALQPDYVEARFGRALLRLQSGHFAEGWSEYEWRFRMAGKAEQTLDRPRWAGEPLQGRTILLRTEQGLGDAIQFIRYAELLKRQGAIVVVECRPALTRLLATAPGVDQVVTRGEPWPHFDVHLPLLSLPGMLASQLEDIPLDIPYLDPDAELVAYWHRELSQTPGFKIGIAWQGSPTYFSDRQRSIPLAHFAGIVETPGVCVYSLQMGPGREQLTESAGRWSIIDWGDRVGDFCNTAAIVRNLDLVISSDTAIVHLAGALGVSVWVALAFSPDWRWMLDRADSPWYPTMRLFRQSRPRDWDGVFRGMQQALTQLL